MKNTLPNRKSNRLKCFDYNTECAILLRFAHKVVNACYPAS